MTTSTRRILVIDSRIPAPDQDAGSKSIYLYMKLFRDLGYTVSFFGDKTRPDENKYRRILEDEMFEIISEPFPSWIRRHGDSVTAAFINRIDILNRYISQVRRFSNARVLFSGCDLRSMRKMRQFQCEGGVQNLFDSFKWRLLESKLHRQADVVFYPSTEEVTILQARNPSLNVQHLPLYYIENDPSPIREQDFENRSGIMFVGGFSHKPNEDGILWFLEKILPLVDDKIEVWIVGSNPCDAIRSYDGGRIHVTGFISDEALADKYRQCRMIIAPLRYGAGVKGKVVESLFMSLPVVTTSIGAEGIPGIENIIPVEDDPASFAEQINSLYSSPAKLARISMSIRNYANTTFSYEKARHIICRAISEHE